MPGHAVTSYQGGHLEFFKYMKDLLDEKWLWSYKKFLVAAAGTILPSEIEETSRFME